MKISQNRAHFFAMPYRNLIRFQTNPVYPIEYEVESVILFMKEPALHPYSGES
ncbi:hypothetical protein D3C73_1436710 [compost metagenome]